MATKKQTEEEVVPSVEPGAPNPPEYTNQEVPQLPDAPGEAQRREDNEAAGRTQAQQQEEAARLAQEAAGTIAVGDRVNVLIDTPEGHPVTGTVVVVQDEAGKRVGVQLDEYTVYAHSLDGRVDEREQGEGLPVVGNGWWTSEENVQKIS